MITRRETPQWYLSPSFIIEKIREKGIIKCSKNLYELVDIKTKRFLEKIPTDNHNINKQPDILYAFYDLDTSPATFDILTFLILAEIERQRIKCPYMHIVIVPGSYDGFRDGALVEYYEQGTSTYNFDTMHWRLRNILVPCCWLIPSCKQITVCGSRKEASAITKSLVKHVFPKKEISTILHPGESYSYSNIVLSISKGITLPSLEPTTSSCRYINDWIQTNAGNRKVITITLRESTYEQDRNSNLNAWGEFAKNLDPNIYLPIIIRDTETAFKPLPFELEGLKIFSEISWNLELRIALYRLSYLNMTVSNGPVHLLMFDSKTRYLAFKIITPSCVVTSENHMDSIGFKIGLQLKHSTLFQRWIWEDDNLEVINREFKKICSKIEHME